MTALTPVHKVHDDWPVLQLIPLRHTANNGWVVRELLEMRWDEMRWEKLYLSRGKFLDTVAPQNTQSITQIHKVSHKVSRSEPEWDTGTTGEGENGVPYTHTVCQYALNRGTEKGHQQTLCDVILPEYPQEVQSLLGPFYLLRKSSDFSLLLLLLVS